jgi:hypothetical protein
MIEYSFASRLYRDELRRRLQVAFAVFGFSSWLIDMTDGYVVSIGVHLAFTHPCYASSGSLIHSSVPRGTM